MSGQWKTFAIQVVSLPILTQTVKDTGIWGRYQSLTSQASFQICLFTNDIDLAGIPSAPHSLSSLAPKRSILQLFKRHKGELVEDSTTTLNAGRGTANRIENTTCV